MQDFKITTEYATPVKQIGLSPEITVIVGLQVIDLVKIVYNVPLDVKAVVVQLTVQNA